MGDGTPSVSAAGRAGAAAVLAAAILAGWRLFPAFSSQIVGIGAVDHYGTLWTWEQLRLAVAQADPTRLVRSPVLYAPFGMDLARNTGLNLLDAALALPFAAVGRFPAHNLGMLTPLVLNGLAAAWIARRRSRHPEAPWLVAIAAALGAYPLYELVEGRPAQALVAPALLALDALLPAPGARLGRAVPTGLLIALAGVGYWFYGLFLGLVALVVGLSSPRARPALGAALVALLVVSPVLARFAAGWSGTPGLRGGAGSPLILHSFQPVLGVVVAEVGDVLVGTQRAVSLALVLGVGLALRRRDVGRAAVVVLALALAVGPTVYAFGAAWPSPAWIVLEHLVPPLSRLWHPSRALVLLVGVGVLGLAEAPRALRLGLVALGLAEAVAAGLLPLPTWDPGVDAADRCLARGEGIVLDLPFGSSQRPLWSQVVHGRPIAGGMHEGAPEFQAPEAVALRETPGYRALLVAAEGGRGDGHVPPGALDELGALGFTQVVLRRDQVPAEPAFLRRRVDAALGGLLGAPVYADARATVWSPWGPAPSCEGIEPDEGPAAPTRERWVRTLGTWPTR